MSDHSSARRVGLAATALAVAVSVAGCGANGASRSNATPTKPGSSGLATSQSPTGGRPVGTAYGESFLVIVSQVNQDLAELGSNLFSSGSAPSGLRLTQIVAPALAELQQADDMLAQIDWPPAAQGDVDTYLAADGALAADLQTLQSGTGSVSSDKAAVLRDLQVRNTAGRALRSDIGVPS